ncbi:anti-sigma factor [Micromonospora endolithica]|uniref:Anti-sigma factor n=1 Tax=Micromonospora endolithica TaxID=230091 RepID=A0A3A9ZPG2_9ACTN|nr:anti-sigma factor [Micromonospora endolithica]RKN49436.1 anti-sigma factor [Micromonospora endolithica]TWJ23633.1 anti-sigma-K factor rskA [Micromonospora endolithica]
MQHLDHDRLVFLALGESEADSGESTHLDTCEHCRVEVETLQHVAGLGAGTQGLRDLPDPPEHVWQGIMTEIRAAESLPSLAEVRSQQQAGTEQRSGESDRNGDGDRPGGPGGGVVLAPSSRRRGRWSRWASTAVTAVAAAAIGVVGTLAVLDPDDSEPAPQVVVASAPLAAYGATPPDANGEARVFDNGRLHLHVANLPDVPGYYEVWLINPTNMEMFSVGVLGGGSDELLPLPPNVDLEAYSVVDVSAEAFDNETAHSGNSLLRGTLTG